MMDKIITILIGVMLAVSGWVLTQTFSLSTNQAVQVDKVSKLERHVEKLQDKIELMTNKDEEIMEQHKKLFEALDKVIEEANELKKEIKKKNKKRIQEELGDMLFASLDVARKLQLNPEISLAKSNEKFSKRWRRLEQFIINDKKEFNDLNLKDFNF